MSQESGLEVEEVHSGIDESTNDETKLRPVPNSRSIIETDFAELEDGSLVELIEDPEDFSKTLLAIFNGKEVHYTREFEYKNRLLVPVPRDGNIVRHVRLPRGTKPFESVDKLLREMDSIFSRCFDLEEDYRILLASFVLSTWFVEKLPTAPYIALVGLPRSGKSTVLRVLSLLCRRSLLTADITSAAFYRACDRLMPTLLIDETATAGERRKLFHLLRTGISRDVIALRRDQSFNAYGAKVVSWLELPNDPALNSRCIVIPMHETKRVDLKRPTDPSILEASGDLQKQLLQYRLEKYKTLGLPAIANEARLYSRTRDLYEALALPLAERENACQCLIDCLMAQQDFSRETLYPAHSAVLEYLYFRIHEWYLIDSEAVTIGDLTAEINEYLNREGESFRLSPRQVGASLTALGFLHRKRTGNGWQILIDNRDKTRIHDLITLYGREHFRQPISPDSIRTCQLCTNLDDPLILIIKKGFLSLPEYQEVEKQRAEASREHREHCESFWNIKA